MLNVSVLFVRILHAANVNAIQIIWLELSSHTNNRVCKWKWTTMNEIDMGKGKKCTKKMISGCEKLHAITMLNAHFDVFASVLFFVFLLSRLHPINFCCFFFRLFNHIDKKGIINGPCACSHSIWQSGQRVNRYYIK